MFSKCLQLRKILEVETYIGYSALCLAEGSTEDGKIIPFDMQPESTKLLKIFERNTI